MSGQTERTTLTACRKTTNLPWRFSARLMTTSSAPKNASSNHLRPQRRCECRTESNPPPGERHGGHRKLATDNHADNNTCIKNNPADTGKIDSLVVLADSVNKPQACGNQVRHPGNERDAIGVLAAPDSEHLRHRHEHCDDGKAPQRLFKPRTGRWSNCRGVGR